MTRKQCKKCGVRKPLNQFGVRRSERDGRRPHCRACVKAGYLGRANPKIPKTKKCRDCGQVKPSAHFTTSNATADGLRTNCLDCYARQHFQYRLNRKIKQVGAPPRGCEICGLKFELVFVPGGSRTRPRYDHNHGTNTFRGWLCTSCNSAIGLLGGNPAIAIAAAAYLKQRGHAVTRSLIR